FVLTKFLGIDVQMDTDIRSVFLLIFFSCIGLTADLRLLKRGGPRLLVFLLALVPFLFLQNIVGVSLAWLLDLHPLMGLLAGSITLVGGHGTGAAYAASFADLYNIQDVMAVAMMAATIGLVMGGVVGGPVAEWLLRRYKIATPGADSDAAHHKPATDGTVVTDAAKPLDVSTFIGSLAAVFVCLGVGQFLAVQL